MLKKHMLGLPIGLLLALAACDEPAGTQTGASQDADQPAATGETPENVAPAAGEQKQD